MPELKRITSLNVVTDTETGQEQIGDIEGGGFNQEWLRKHIACYGTKQLLETIVYMSHQIHEAQLFVNAANEMDAHCGPSI